MRERIRWNLIGGKRAEEVLTCMTRFRFPVPPEEELWLKMAIWQTFAHPNRSSCEFFAMDTPDDQEGPTFYDIGDDVTELETGAPVVEGASEGEVVVIDDADVVMGPATC